MLDIQDGGIAHDYSSVQVVCLALKLATLVEPTKADRYDLVLTHKLTFTALSYDPVGP